MSEVLLGFPDELISEKYVHQIDYTVNKIGGKPDFPNGTKWEIPKCPSCKLPRPLVVQIYAPLEKSQFHRTLYVFGCINPMCWKKSECWLCIRMQLELTTPEITEDQAQNTKKPNPIEWCTDADDWDVDDTFDDFKETKNSNEINIKTKTSSADVPIECGFANLSVDARDEKAKHVGIERKQVEASAEIEDVQSNSNVILETPTLPNYNVLDLIKEATPLPKEIICGGSVSQLLTCVEFVPLFITVWHEQISHDKDNKWGSVSNRHVLDLLKNYEEKVEKVMSNPPEASTHITLPGLTEEIPEDYEKNTPLHGDKMFHHFLSRIQANPGQILRYDRDSQPLLLYPIKNLPTKCQYCQGPMTFEFQLIPTIISNLRLITDQDQVSRLEFGTVLIFTCRSSCWSSSNSPLKTEVVILQEERY